MTRNRSSLLLSYFSFYQPTRPEPSTNSIIERFDLLAGGDDSDNSAAQTSVGPRALQCHEMVIDVETATATENRTAIGNAEQVTSPEVSYLRIGAATTSQFRPVQRLPAERGDSNLRRRLAQRLPEEHTGSTSPPGLAEEHAGSTSRLRPVQRVLEEHGGSTLRFQTPQQPHRACDQCLCRWDNTSGVRKPLRACDQCIGRWRNSSARRKPHRPCDQSTRRWNSSALWKPHRAWDQCNRWSSNNSGRGKAHRASDQYNHRWTNPGCDRGTGC